MNRVQGFYSLLSKAEHLATGFICPGADGPVLHPCGQAGGRWAGADAEPQRAFCHLEISQETGLSCTGVGVGGEKDRREGSGRALKQSVRTGSCMCSFKYKNPPELSADSFTQSPHLQRCPPPANFSPRGLVSEGPPGSRAVECVGIGAGRRDCSSCGQPAWAHHLAGRRAGTFEVACPALSASSRCPWRLSKERLGDPAGRQLGEAGKVTSSVTSPGPQRWGPDA